MECINADLLPPNCDIDRSGFFSSKEVREGEEIVVVSKCDPKCAYCEENTGECSACV